MRKRLISPIRQTNSAPAGGWLDLGQAALVEVTSEAEGYPIEGALLKDGQRGGRANGPGMQTIRLLFDHPQHQRPLFVSLRYSAMLTTSIRSSSLLSAGNSSELMGPAKSEHRFRSSRCVPSNTA